MIGSLNSVACTSFFNPGKEMVEQNGKMAIFHELFHELDMG